MANVLHNFPYCHELPIVTVDMRIPGCAHLTPEVIESQWLLAPIQSLWLTAAGWSPQHLTVIDLYTWLTAAHTPG